MRVRLSQQVVDRGARTIALLIEGIGFANAATNTLLMPGWYHAGFDLVLMAVLGSAIVVGLFAVVRGAGRLLHRAVMGYGYLSVLIVLLHDVFRVHSTQEPGVYPPLVHAVLPGLMALALFLPRWPVFLIAVGYSVWLTHLRTPEFGFTHSLLEALVSCNTLVIAYVAAEMVRRATGQVEEKSAGLHRELMSEHRARQRAFEQQRWNGLIHDRLLGSLRLAAREPVGAPVPVEARELAIGALEMMSGQQHDTADPLLGETLIEIAERLGLTARVDLAEQDLPNEVAEAVLDAAHQALTNVALHADVDTVTITGSATGAGVDVEIVDTGVGFDPDQIDARRLGVRLGLQGRMEMVGGSARVVSRPGRGTRVGLSWRPKDEESPVARFELPRDLLVLFVALGAAATLLHIVLGLFYLDVFTPSWLPVLCMLVVFGVSVGFAAIRADNDWAVGGLVAVALAVPLALSLTMDLPSVGDWRFWYIGAFHVSVAMLGFRIRSYAGVLFTVTMVAVQCLVFAWRGDSPWVSMASSHFGVLISGAGAGLVRGVVRNANRLIEEDSLALRASGRAIIAAEERSRESRRRIALLGAIATPSLTRLAEAVQPLDSAFQEDCRLLEAGLRDQLTAGELIDPGLRDALSAARQRGVSVEITATAAPDARTPEFRAAVQRILAGTGPGESVVVRWRPNNRGRVGNVTVQRAAGEGTWRLPECDAGHELTLTVSTDEMAMLVEIHEAAVPPAEDRCGDRAGK